MSVTSKVKIKLLFTVHVQLKKWVKKNNKFSLKKKLAEYDGW